MTDRLYSIQQDIAMTGSGEKLTLATPTGWDEVRGLDGEQQVSLQLADSSECWIAAEGTDLDPFKQRITVQVKLDIVCSPGIPRSKSGAVVGWFCDRHDTRIDLVAPQTDFLVPTLKEVSPTPANGFTEVTYTEQDGAQVMAGSFSAVSLAHSEAKTVSTQVPNFQLFANQDGASAVFSREYSHPLADGSDYDPNNPGWGVLSKSYLAMAKREVAGGPVGALSSVVDPSQRELSSPAAAAVSDQTYVCQGLWDLVWPSDPTLYPDTYKIRVVAKHTTRYVFVVANQLAADELGKPEHAAWTNEHTATFEGEFAPRTAIMAAYERIKAAQNG